MQVHCNEGVAIRIGPEPCGVIREDGVEASVGVRAGQPLSHDIVLSRVPTLSTGWKAISHCAPSQVQWEPGVVVEPGMYASSLRGNREISSLTVSASIG